MELPVNYDSIPSAKKRTVREEYVKLQEGKCWYCDEPLNGDASPKILSKPVNRKLFPPNFFKWPVHLHHSHDTGMTIGSVHCYCNAVLWQYDNQ